MTYQSAEQVPVDGDITSPEMTEPAIFVPEVAKQHDVFVCAIAFGVLVSTRACFWLDEIIRKFVECFNEDLPKPALTPPIPPTIQGERPFMFHVTPKIYNITILKL